MLNDSDLKKIGDLIDQRLNTGLTSSEERISEKIASSITTSEERLGKKIASSITTSEERINKKLEAMEKRIIQETGEFVTNNLLTQFDEKAEVKDVLTLEKRVGKLEKEALVPHLV